MSNRKSGSGGRKAKAGKNKQAKGGGGGSGGGSGGSLSSAFSNNGLQLPRDEYHNMAIPSCGLLFQLTREMLGLMVDTHNINQTLQPASLLGQMIRKHLNEKRKKQLATANHATTAGGGASSSTSPNKKKPKKKKKKKKGGNSNVDGTGNAASTPAAAPEVGGQQDADETDSTSVIASTVSQDSQQQQPQQAVSAARSSTTSTATATTIASTTTTADNNMVTTASGTALYSSSSAALDSNFSSTTPVDLYLDRVQGVIEQKEKVLEDSADNSRAIKGPVIRDIDAFLHYLNSSAATKNSLSITQQELEHASTFIVCPVCRERVQTALKHIAESKQPVVLPSIPFHASSSAQTNNNYSSSSNSNHNGLAIPIHNQKPNAPPPPAPTVDFDYVAMEEGSSPMGTLLEAKADLQGIPYFHPHVLTNTMVETAAATTTTNNNNNSSSSSSSNNNKVSEASSSSGHNHSGSGKKQNKKGATSDELQSKVGTKTNQLEWRFVSCSCCSSETPSQQQPTTATREGSPSTTKTAAARSDQPQQASSSSSSFMTLDDLEHIVKDLMIPLATPPDELLGTTPMSDHDLHDIQTRTSNLEHDFVHEISVIHGDIQKYQSKFAQIVEMEDSTHNDLAIMSGVNDYHELDEVIYKILVEIVIEVMWDRLLWLGGGGNETFVIRHTPDWETMVAYLTDKSAQAILSIMRAVETYESRLQDDIADNTGKIPELFVSKGHRIVYRTMVETKLRLLSTLLQEIRVASETLQDAWPQITGGRVGIGGHHGGGEGLLLTFRQKWFVEQECYRKYAEMQRREENENSNAASGNSRRTSSSPGNKVKKDISSQIHQNQMQRNSSSFVVYNGVNQKWFRELATNGEDLFRGLIALSKHVATGRISEQREEHMMRCEKHLGLLKRVGGECIRPVVEKDAKATGYVVKDPNLLDQCANLWTQITQQSHLPQQQQLLAQNGEGPSIVEQKDTMAQLTVSLLRLLRNLRKHVAENCRPKETPMMPLNAFAGFVNRAMGDRYLDLTKVSYDMLVGIHVSTIASCKSHYSTCTGGSAQPRLTALFLALFYKKLSEQCSEWHAELAEQELLITMGESNAEGTNGLSISLSGEQTSKKDGASNKNGVSTNATNGAPAKNKNKRKKNKNREKSTTAEANEGSKDTKSTDTNTGQEDGKDATATVVGVESNGLAAEASTVGQPQHATASIEFSTVPVDKDMGVMEPSGAILTAESYLVGRLTSILNGSTTQGSGQVVII